MNLKKLCTLLMLAPILCAARPIPDNILYAWEEAGSNPPPSFVIRDGTLYGFSGCNRLFGPVTKTKQGFKMTAPIGMTKRYCDDGEIENSWTTLLEQGVRMVPVRQKPKHWQAYAVQDPLVSYPLVEQGRYLELDIAEQRRDCTGVGPMKCLVVREHGAKGKESRWSNFYDSIEGFEPQEGTAYRIRVLRQERANPPADASRYTWTLDEILQPKAPT